jgi:hypothetical protein
MQVIEHWQRAFEAHAIECIVASNDGSKGRGCGFAKNQAVAQSYVVWL